eukprot:evm.model.NODE_18923_length_31468_cov_28.147610.1
MEEWDIVSHVFHLAVVSGAISPPPPPPPSFPIPPAAGAEVTAREGGIGGGGGGGGVAASTGSRKLDKYLYGGAVAAAKERGDEKEVERLITGLCEALSGVEGGREGVKEEYLHTVEDCVRSRDWFPLMEYYGPSLRGRGGGYNAWQQAQQMEQQRKGGGGDHRRRGRR